MCMILSSLHYCSIFMSALPRVVNMCVHLALLSSGTLGVRLHESELAYWVWAPREVNWHIECEAPRVWVSRFHISCFFLSFNLSFELTRVQGHILNKPVLVHRINTLLAIAAHAGIAMPCQNTSLCCHKKMTAIFVFAGQNSVWRWWRSITWCMGCCSDDSNKSRDRAFAENETAIQGIPCVNEYSSTMCSMTTYFIPIQPCHTSPPQ